MAAHDDPLVPASVWTAFGLTGQAHGLIGGMGQSVRVGDVVLKPTGDETEAAWLAQVQHDLHLDQVRAPSPRQALDGRWVVDGRTASTYLPGAERPDRWAEVITAGRRFHAALAGVPRPSLIQARTHRRAVADRVAWGETHRDLGALGSRLAASRHRLDLPRQLVHCDLSGNVLFHDDEPPAIIDLSLYWRPVPYADAIVVVDAFLWYGADPGILDLVDHPDAKQLLLRAALFRLACELAPDHEGDPTALTDYKHLTDLIERR